jgi:ADP-ribose pyrophosphatase
MDWEIIDRSLGYQGFFRLDVLHIRHALYGGGWSPTLTRELFRRSDAVAVLPYDPVRDRVLLIEQFRMGAIDAPHGPWLTEIIAGLVEPGEGREQVAHREAREEANCELQALYHVVDYYSSPGGFSERVSIYLAKADLNDPTYGIHGPQSEGEDIRVQVIGAQQAFDKVASGAIVSAMPIIALQWLHLNREMIRGLWK